MPSGERKPIMMPLAASSASRWPERTWMRVPSAFSPRAMNSGPSEASRQAAVAIAQHVLDAEDAGDGLEPAQRLERQLDALLAEMAGRADLPAQAAQHLLVEDRRGAAAPRPRRRRGAPSSSRCRRRPSARARCCARARRCRGSRWQAPFVAAEQAHARSAIRPCSIQLRRSACSLAARLNRRGKLSFSDCPRPERLGLVMKYSCALNGSSPSAGRMRSEEPSARMRQLCWLSFRFATMIWSRICSCTVGFMIGTSTSTRRSRLRGIMSAEPI